MEYDENKVLTEWNYSAPNIFYMQISINILLTQVTSCHNSNTGRRSRKKAPVYTFSNTRDNWQFAVSL